MQRLRIIFAIIPMLAFTFNAMAGSAFDVCDCDHSDSQIVEKPYSESNFSEAEHVAVNDAEQESTQCVMCDCGHCKSHSQMSLGHNAVSLDVPMYQISDFLHMGFVMPSIAYGVDNPPKPIS